MIAEILTKDRPELIAPVVKRLEDNVDKIVVCYTTSEPILIDKMLQASKVPIDIVVNNFDNKCVAYRYVWDDLKNQDGLFLDDNVWFKPEYVGKIQEQMDNHREASMISAWMKMGDFSNMALEETIKPWKFFVVNNKLADKVKPDIKLPRGMYDDKQLGIDSWLFGYPMYRDMSLQLNRKNVGRPSGIIGLNDMIGGREELKAYYEVGWRYFKEKYPFATFTKEYAVVIGLTLLKSLYTNRNFFIEEVREKVIEANNLPYDYDAHITKIYSN